VVFIVWKVNNFLAVPSCSTWVYVDLHRDSDINNLTMMVTIIKGNPHFLWNTFNMHHVYLSTLKIKVSMLMLFHFLLQSYQLWPNANDTTVSNFNHSSHNNSATTPLPLSFAPPLQCIDLVALKASILAMDPPITPYSSLTVTMTTPQQHPQYPQSMSTLTHCAAASYLGPQTNNQYRHPT